MVEAFLSRQTPAGLRTRALTTEKEIGNMGQESRLCEATEAGESQQSPVTKVWRKARPIARRLSLGTGTGPDFCTWASAKLSAAHIDPGAPRIRAPLARWQPLRCILRQDRSAATQIPLPAARCPRPYTPSIDLPSAPSRRPRSHSVLPARMGVALQRRRSGF